MLSGRAATRTGRTLASLAAAIAIASIWIHLVEVGASSPEEPSRLVKEQTWSAFGRWPYLVVTDAGAEVRWPGLLRAVVATLLVIVVALRWWGRTPIRGPEPA